MFCSKIEDDEKFNREFGDLIENQIYEANNRDGSLYKINENEEKYVQDENIKYNNFKNFLSWLYVFFFILIVCFILFDLITYVRNKNKENKIEREYCLLV